MSTFTPNDLRNGLRGLRWPLRLTWAGMVAEALVLPLTEKTRTPYRNQKKVDGMHWEHKGCHGKLQGK